MHRHTLISDWLFPLNRATIITCIMCVLSIGPTSLVAPSSAMRLFYFPDGRNLAKIMCIRYHNNETVARRPRRFGLAPSTGRSQQLPKYNRFVFCVWSHKWISFSMIWSMFRPLLLGCWLLLNIAFNEYDFLEKWPFIVAFLLLIDWKNLRTSIRTVSFQFKHWISQNS